MPVPMRRVSLSRGSQNFQRKDVPFVLLMLPLLLTLLGGLLGATLSPPHPWVSGPWIWKAVDVGRRSAFIL